MSTEIDTLKEYHKNPRKITGKQYNLLSESLKEFGDLSGVVVNTVTGEVIGGNQRTRILKSEGAKIEITQRFAVPTSTGTTAVGYIILNDEKYNYREVSWDVKKEEIANIRANKVGGMFDFDILANQFDVEILQESGFEEQELGFARVKDLDRETDLSDSDAHLETYLGNNIKQITLYYTNEEYEAMLNRLDVIGKKLGVESNTDVINAVIKYYEDNNS